MTSYSRALAHMGRLATYLRKLYLCLSTRGFVKVLLKVSLSQGSRTHITESDIDMGYHHSEWSTFPLDKDTDTDTYEGQPCPH